MGSNAIAIVLLLAALLQLVPLPVVHAQSERCTGRLVNGNQNVLYACTGRSSLRTCNADTATFKGPEESCDSLGAGLVCLAGYSSATTVTDVVCVPAPPACTQAGAFPIPPYGNGIQRCSDFYLCVSRGQPGEFNQYFSECDLGYEFNVKLQTCSSNATANCSILLPPTTTEAPTTTVAPTSTTTVAPLKCSVADQRLPDSTSCYYFYQCSSAAPLTMSRVICPFNSLFDTTNKYCVTSTACGSRPLVV